MKKKFVVAAVAVAMAAVVSVSAFAATGTYVPSITGGEDSTIYTPKNETSDTTVNEIYDALTKTETTTDAATGETVTTSLTLEEKLDIMTTTVGSSNTDEAAAAVAEAKKIAEEANEAGLNGYTVRSVGQLSVAEGDSNASLIVNGLDEGDVVIVMYLDANNKWVTRKAVAGKGGVIVLSGMPSTTSMTVLAPNKAQKK